LHTCLTLSHPNYLQSIPDILPERACAQGWISAKAMKAGIACTTLLAGITGLCLLYYGGLEMIPVGIACMIFAFLCSGFCHT
jgi:hypothetical protein